ncbi:MAG: hypothetical protein CMH80_07810, partial [Nitrospinae bacterium]|nr:hypothetical protein [Nitrospinota bacterium]
MRVEFIRSIDFNQMLVYSTFVHLVALTIVMFLPSPRIQEQIVVPTFKLDLIELPSALKSASSPVKKQVVVAPPVKKRVAAKAKPIAKKLERREIKAPVSKPIAKKPERREIRTPVS